MKDSLRKRSVRQLANAPLQATLDKALRGTMEKREKALHPESTWEALREAAHAIRSRVVENLDCYLLLAAASLEKSGVIVHWASDAEEACAIVTGIAREHSITKVVKSKSMVGEEIELNAAFHRSGVEAVETDLGEFIVQLAGQMPSHLTAPAVHLSRYDVTDIFTAKLGLPRSEDPVVLAAQARDFLREKFLGAEMGISGANFILVDAGRVVVVENEANAAISTTLPRIHVALAGIERLIPTAEDLGVMLELLARSATGQRSSAYVSVLGGPQEGPYPLGPDEVHVVFIDNGRSRLLADPVLREALCCIRCGACLNTCPIFRRIGGHGYASVYSGPIGAVVTPVLTGDPRYSDLPFASSLCGRCDAICPVRIPLTSLLLTLRARIQKERPSTSEALLMKAYRFYFAHPTLLALSATLGRWSQAALSTVAEVPVPGWSVIHAQPRLASPRFSQWLKRRSSGGTD